MSRFLSARLTLVSALPLVGLGCGNYTEDLLNKPYEPALVQPAVMAPDPKQDSFNTVRLKNLPAGVQAAFRSEHPAVHITSVDTISTGTGPFLYRIAYMDDGSAGTATYSANGRETERSNAFTMRQDDSLRPRAKYGTTQPAGSSARFD